MLKLFGILFLIAAGYMLLTAATAFAYTLVKYCLFGGVALLAVGMLWPESK